MIILKGDKGNIDFAHPLELNELQKEQFLNFLREMFAHVREEGVNEIREDRIGSKSFSRAWDDEEYELLLKIDEKNDFVSRKLGRSWMAVNMRRLDFVPEMMQYANKKGINVYDVDIKELVKDFLEEHRDEIFKRKKQKKKVRKEKKEDEKKLERLKIEIPKLEKLTGMPGFPTKKKLEEMKRIYEELKEKFSEER